MIEKGEGPVGVDGLESDGSTPLMAAADGGHQKIVRQLLEAGADWEEKDGEGCTALALAVAGGHLEAATVLRDWAASHDSGEPKGGKKEKSECRDGESVRQPSSQFGE